MINQDQIQGGWEQFIGKVKETWGKMTDDDIALLEGNRQQFYGKLQENYGIAKEQAEKQLKDIADRSNYSKWSDEV